MSLNRYLIYQNPFPMNDQELTHLDLRASDQDCWTILPMRITRAEAKIFYGLLMCQIYDQAAQGVDNEVAHAGCKALALKLYSYITDTPLPSQS